MSQQGIQTTTITLADGPNELREVLQMLAKKHPDIIKRLPSMTTMWEECYELTKAGEQEFAVWLSHCCGEGQIP
jgi:hypothetical protein